jgi:hypothetical protein
MTEILANIYGTFGMEKSASAEGLPENLSDLALALVHSAVDEGDDLTKVASAHGEVLDNLVQFDRAGRAMAHHEFSSMEKAASEGDTSALEEFFADDDEPDEREVLRQQVLAELARRQ